jgi:hypothetical protein
LTPSRRQRISLDVDFHPGQVDAKPLRGALRNVLLEAIDAVADGIAAAGDDLDVVGGDRLIGAAVADPDLSDGLKRFG